MVAKRHILVGVLSLLFPLVMVLPGYTKSPEASKKVIRIGGVPADWLASRMQDVMVADAIGRRTDYDVKIIGGVTIGADRFLGLQEGKFDMTIDIYGYWGIHAVFKNVENLSKRFKFLAIFPQSLNPQPLIVHKDLPISSLREAIEKRYPLKVGTGRIGSFDNVDNIWRIMGAPNGVQSVEEWGGRVEKSSAPAKFIPLIREGVLNAHFSLGGLYEPQLEAIHSVRPLKCLPVAQDEKDLQLIN